MDIEVTSSLNITVMLDAGAYVIACNKTVDSLIKISERASRLAQWQRISLTDYWSICSGTTCPNFPVSNIPAR